MVSWPTAVGCKKKILIATCMRWHEDRRNQSSVEQSWARHGTGFPTLRNWSNKGLLGDGAHSHTVNICSCFLCSEKVLEVQPSRDVGVPLLLFCLAICDPIRIGLRATKFDADETKFPPLERTVIPFLFTLDIIVMNFKNPDFDRYLFLQILQR